MQGKQVNMKKPWSITTTVRNPERIKDFLKVAKELSGAKWDFDAQKKYQILLIKHRVYGYGNAQFYKGLTVAQKQLLDNLSKDISFDEAKKIFDSKKYEDPAMRGRQSINPLRKLGLAVVKDGRLYLTELGELALTPDYDLGEMFFRSFIKWQIPNPDSDDYDQDDGYNIKPFIGVLHLIHRVNAKSLEAGKDAKGISKQEFSLFAPSLVNFRDIDKYADEIVKLRRRLNNKEKSEQKEIFDDFSYTFAKKFLESEDPKEIEGFLSNLRDYGDNAIRYFRLTRYIYIRGGGFYIDLEPRRRVEINNLLSFDSGESDKFASKEEYHKYISDITEPKLPWETKEKYIEIIEGLFEEIREYEERLKAKNLAEKDYRKMAESDQRKYIETLRLYRRELQEQENHFSSRELAAVERYITAIKNIHNEADTPIALEKYIALSLHALNDALRIKPNYPVGDDNEPTFTAPANKPDIECFYKTFNAICEVTMLTGRNQWYNEGQPVMRHLRDFENQNPDKDTYCVFLAPSLHRDTLNTFWTSVKYEYEGKRQKIVPLSLTTFLELLKTLAEMKRKGRFLTHGDIIRLYDGILSEAGTAKNVTEWLPRIPLTISKWKAQLTA
ncbi:MAG: AlwI family type II restriction endonuclease [bacterium]